jgi:hypothetical protein
MLAMDFSSYTVPSTLLKESSIRVTLAQTVLEPITDQAAILEWIALIKPPPEVWSGQRRFGPEADGTTDI